MYVKICPIDPFEAEFLSMSGSARLIDLREADERKELLPGALWFPASTIDLSLLPSFDPTLGTVCRCIFVSQDGTRAMEVAEQWAKEFRSVVAFTLSGGVNEWISQGFPLISASKDTLTKKEL